MHTQGEWRVDYHEDIDGFAVVSARGVKIATACDLLIETLPEPNQSERRAEIVGNGALIAAAPDLLAACEIAVSHIEQEIETMRRWNRKPIGGAGDIRFIKFAIAKAKGGE